MLAATCYLEVNIKHILQFKGLSVFLYCLSTLVIPIKRNASEEAEFVWPQRRRIFCTSLFRVSAYIAIVNVRAIPSRSVTTHLVMPL
jgi:hypothetical protein